MNNSEEPPKPIDSGIVFHDNDGVSIIAAERRRQIEKGYLAENDDAYLREELPTSAAACALGPATSMRKKLYAFVPLPKTFRLKPAEMTIEQRILELARAGALAAAEIDRLARLSKKIENARVAQESKSSIITPPGFNDREDLRS